MEITINAINLPIVIETAAIFFTSKNIVLDKIAFKIFQPQNTRLNASLTQVQTPREKHLTKTPKVEEISHATHLFKTILN
jgi:hypothetical protein